MSDEERAVEPRSTHPHEAGASVAAGAALRGRPARAIRVILVEDHLLVRYGLTLVLTGQGIDVVGEASGPEDAFELVRVQRPDVVILDLTLEEADGLPFLRELKSRHRDVQVVVLTMHHDPETVRQALLAGAAGYVVKGARSSDLLDAIRAVAHGDRYVHSSVAGVVVDDSVRWLRSGSGLSEREREILGLVAGGNSAPMIAERLGISIHTVHRHVANLSAKLEVHGQPALIRYAIEHDFVLGGSAQRSRPIVVDRSASRVGHGGET